MQETISKALDFSRMQAFSGRLLSDFGTAQTILACTVGDKLGLFKKLATIGPVNGKVLAKVTGFDEILVLRWLEIMTASKYLDFDSSDNTFTLPAEHGILADLDAQSGLAGGFQLFLAFSKTVESLIAAFKTHQGVDQSDYDEDLRTGMERMSAPWFESSLVESWIPAAGLDQKLSDGLRAADIGCGRGRALFRLAHRYPNSIFTGYDFFSTVVNEARQIAKEKGIEQRVQFRAHDVSQPLPEEYDLITFFNSLHDVTRPVEGLTRVREALAPGGACLILESAFSDRLEDNINPLGTVLYGTSLFYNTPVSIANGAVSAGRAVLSESRIRELCGSAGLQVTRLRLPNPMHALYIAST